MVVATALDEDVGVDVSGECDRLLVMAYDNGGEGDMLSVMALRDIIFLRYRSMSTAPRPTGALSGAKQTQRQHKKSRQL